jgi:RNA polymerase sigma factor (sigma-70 family)
VESLEALMAAHGAALLRLAFMLSGSADAAQDLTQDTCVKLHRHWPKVARADSSLAYAKRVMVNEYIRTAKRKAASEVLVAEPALLAGEPAGGSFEGELVDRERLWSLLGTLPAAQRAAVVLRYYEDLSDTQAAALLGCRASTVRSNTAKALARLRRVVDAGEGVAL